MNLQNLTKNELIEKLQEANKQLEELKKNSASKEQLDEKEQEIRNLAEKVKDSELTVEELKGEIAQKEQQISAINQDKKTLISDKAVLEEKVQVLSGHVAPVETCFLIPRALGIENLTLIERSIKEQFIGESTVTLIGDPEMSLLESLQDAFAKEEIPDEFVLLTYPCVAINPFNKLDLQLLKSMPNGDFFTQLPVLLQKDKVEDLLDSASIEELLNSYFANQSYDGQLPLKLSLESDNLKCGVYRSNPVMSIVRDSLRNKKFFCFDENGMKAIKPFLDNLYPEGEDK